MVIIDDGSVLKKVNIRWIQKDYILFILGNKDIMIPRLKNIEHYTISMSQLLCNTQIRESIRLKVLYGK